MLIPLPEGDLEDALLVRGADLLGFLGRQSSPVVVEEAMLDFLKRHPKSQAEDFIDCLTVLFALGLIEYSHFRIAKRGME